MKVVLLDNIKGIGKVGEIKEVNDGYARNFLIRRGLGKPASPGAIKESEQLKMAKLEARALAHAQAVAAAATLAKAPIAMSGKANERGKLFSGITETDIAERLSTIAGAHLAPTAIILESHLKTLGEHTVHVRLTEDVSTDVIIHVEATP